MILLHPFPIGELRNEIVRTAMNAETTEDDEVGAVAVFQFYTVEVIADKK